MVPLPVLSQRPPGSFLRVQPRLCRHQRRLQLRLHCPHLLKNAVRCSQLAFQLRGTFLSHHEAACEVLGVQLGFCEGALEAGDGVGAGGDVLLQC
jgi:hypothetical protein